ncbi:hypothetical protein ABZ707_28640 [Streptomyces sp. NPDC006923]|uniref:hypothetical protein n=1 Tax=Streptomyces sp. NPDC006923 TaxID=3155355 RepID=UPI00340521F0
MPATTAAMLPQAEHGAERRWQSGHHGWPVMREVPQGFSSPQMLQAAVGREGQFEQSGPSGVRVLTTFRLPQLMQVSRFAGALTRQFGHSGRPWSSRLAGSRRAPQPEHSSMREWAMQVRQTTGAPSSGCPRPSWLSGAV